VRAVSSMCGKTGTGPVLIRYSAHKQRKRTLLATNRAAERAGMLGSQRYADRVTAGTGMLAWQQHAYTASVEGVFVFGMQGGGSAEEKFLSAHAAAAEDVTYPLGGVIRARNALRQARSAYSTHSRPANTRCISPAHTLSTSIACLQVSPACQPTDGEFHTGGNGDRDAAGGQPTLFPWRLPLSLSSTVDSPKQCSCSRQ
jgi:hypothetical protein